MSITNCDEFYLKKYRKFVEFVVNNFISKGNGRSLGIREDLIQEAQLALLKWIKKNEHKKIFDVANSCLYINGCLYEYAKLDTGIHMDHHKLKEFYKKYQVVPVEDYDKSIDWLENVDYEIDFERWKNTLSPRQNAILLLMLSGYNIFTISKILGITRQTVYDILNTSIRPKYNAYFHPEQNPTPTKKRKSKSTPTAA